MANVFEHRVGHNCHIKCSLHTSLALKWNKLCGHEVEAPTTTFIVNSLVVQHWI
jgi:hypothetical protein